MANLIGQSLGRYHILEQLGEGGMAVVYKAFDTRLERNVAIKVILPGKEQSDKFLKRFEREAKALAQLSHPNIVKVIDYGDYNGFPYLVMEYLPGGTLKQKLTGKPMDWTVAVQIILPIARALGYSHEQKIIHRDVKSSNILITQSGEPMLSDFGIAKVLEADETLDLTGVGVGVGTPEYMSPEQAQGNHVDPRSDVYSLGVVFYEMVTGRKPYQAETPMAVVYKLASEPLPRPRDFSTNIPEVVEQVLLKSLAKSPKERYQNMSEFASALQNLGTYAGVSYRKSDGKNLVKREKWNIPFRSWLTPLLALVIALFGFMVFQGLSGDKKQISMTPSTPTVTKVYLATLSPRTAAVGWAEFSASKYTFDSEQDDIYKGDPIILLGEEYAMGLFAHAPSRIVYEIDGIYSSFETIAGKDGGCGNGVIFRIVGDGEVLFESELSPGFPHRETISVDVSHRNTLELIADAGPFGNIDCDEVIWGDPVLIK